MSNELSMVYNSSRDALIMPEYGRNIQKLIRHARTIEEKEERQAFIKKVVDLMMQLYPQNRNVDDYRIKLWNDVFQVADYDIDVIPPDGNVPVRGDHDRIPETVGYPKSEAKFRHYGHNVQKLINKALEMEDSPKRVGFVNVIGAYMKLAYKTWNKDHYVSDNIIKGDLEALSDGKLSIDENTAIENLSHSNNSGGGSNNRRDRDNNGRRNSGKRNQSGGTWRKRPKRKQPQKKIVMVINAFEVLGGNKLKGEIHPQGAKNEALQILAATLLTKEKVTISNLPNILDVQRSIALLKGLGVKVNQIDEHQFTFQADHINLDYFDDPKFIEDAVKIRGSVMLIGPLLARFGRAFLPSPGGDKIGRRRLDTHFKGLQRLGAEFTFNAEARSFSIRATQLTGQYILMDEISVTGTANVVMAAVMAKGTTQIYNAACEPYVQQLCKLLIRMGAKISGVGSNLLTIEGVDQLSGATHEILPDMIEIGSFIGLAAMTQSEITIKEVRPAMLGIIPNTFRRLGIELEFRGNDIYIPPDQDYEIQSFIDGSTMTIYDAPWPGFTPDLMSIVLVVATQAKGEILIHQKMFESRLFFVDKLIDMGARIILCDPHRATVIGLGRRYPLKGISMTSPDIRAGVALLIAALSAKGKSVIHNINQIDRGYEAIDTRLNQLGAQIKRL